MIICTKCKGTSIKSRSNYSHGKKSKARTSFTCKRCGSTDVEVKSERRGRGPNRR